MAQRLGANSDEFDCPKASRDILHDLNPNGHLIYSRLFLQGGV